MIYEYRVYQYPHAAARAPALEMIKAAFPFFEKHGMKVIGCWETFTTISPNSSQIIYMLAFENLAHLESAWAAFRSDETWLSKLREVTDDGMPDFVNHFSNYVMSPTDFSPLP